MRTFLVRRRRAAALAASAVLVGAAGAALCAVPLWQRPAAPGRGWSRGPELPSPRGEVAVAATDREIVVIGGLEGAGGSTARADILDLRNLNWRQGPSLPLPLNHAAAAALGGRVYVAGGSEQFGRPPRREVYALELPDARSWQRVAPLPSGRWAAGMASVPPQLLVAGGTGDSPTATFAYDARADRWEQRAPLSGPREHLGVAAAGGLVYAVGGRWGGRNLATAEAYDVAADQWQSLPQLPTARSGLGLAAVAAAGWWFLIATGGEDPGLPGHVFPEAEMFAAGAGTWRTLPPLPTPRHGLGAAASNLQAYFIAGATLPGARSVLAWSGAVDVYSIGTG